MKLVLKGGYNLEDSLPYGVGSDDLLSYIYDRYIRCWEVVYPMDRSLIKEVHLYWVAYVRGGNMLCDIMGLSQNHSFSIDVVGMRSWLLYMSRDNKIESLLC